MTTYPYWTQEGVTDAGASRLLTRRVNHMLNFVSQIRAMRGNRGHEGGIGTGLMQVASAMFIDWCA